METPENTKIVYINFLIRHLKYLLICGIIYRVLRVPIVGASKTIREYILSTKISSNIITTDKTVKFEELKHQKPTKNSMIKILKVEWE